MKTRLDSTASSWGVMTSGIRLTAPRVPWMVSSSVSPVSTRVVIVFSASLSVAHDGMSLDSGTFSGSQKLLVRRCQTSRSLGSSTRFQLMAYRGSISFVVMSPLGRRPRSPCRRWVMKARRRDSLDAGRGRTGSSPSQLARDASLGLGAGEGLLANPDVVEALDPLAPGVDVGLVEVAGGDRVGEEEGQRQALVHVLGGGGVGVDDLLGADLVGVGVVLEVVVRHERSRVVDAPELALLADLHLRHDRVDGGGGVVDVGDRAGR